MMVSDPKTPLLAVRDGLSVFDAGLPRFPRNFTRDGILAALLAADTEMMRNQLKFCAIHQGAAFDPTTGEEPGKIHHEMPGYPIRDRMTTYNASDAAGLYLLGHGWLQDREPDDAFVDRYRDSIERAAAYVESHLDESGLFVESPAYCGADRFALKVTYWKDSVLLDREAGEPIYPVVYPLAHIQNLAGMRAAGRLLKRVHIMDTAEMMASALDQLYDDGLGCFLIAKDAAGPIHGVSSDSLHALYYLEEGDLSRFQIERIERASESLESQIGYMLLSPEDGARMGRSYHAHTVWPFEQGLIHAGARKFGLERVQRIARRVTRQLASDSYPELLAVEVSEPNISSNPQLWTIAAERYFSNHASI